MGPQGKGLTGHGADARYKAGCRCEGCRLAHNAANREAHRRKMRRLDPDWTPDGWRAKHGTNSKYTSGCRCGACAEAHRVYRREQNYRNGLAHPKVDAEKVRPLIECMVGFGLEKRRIADAAGCSASTLRLLRPTVWLATAKAVEDLHTRLWVNHEPFRSHCSCAASWRLLEWVGEETVEDRLKRAGIA